MVTVWIGGGLGNQLFMCAYAMALQKRGYKVALDVETFFNFQKNKKLKTKKTIISKNNLDKFNINIPFVMPSQSRLKYVVGGEKIEFVEEFVKKIGIYSIYNWENSEYADKYLREMLTVNRNAYIMGYFQSDKFFKRYEKEICEMFTLKKDVNFSPELLAERNKEIPLVGIHFRRKDYKYENELYILEMKYYENAVRFLQSKIGRFDICVFSDDCRWVKKNFNVEDCNILYPSDFVEYKDYEEMILMSKCDHNIIANSTFSWWGAWLNQNKNKMVIAPKMWMKSKRYKIVPDNWIKI